MEEMAKLKRNPSNRTYWVAMQLNTKLNCFPWIPRIYEYRSFSLFFCIISINEQLIANNAIHWTLFGLNVRNRRERKKRARLMWKITITPHTHWERTPFFSPLHGSFCMQPNQSLSPIQHCSSLGVYAPVRCQHTAALQFTESNGSTQQNACTRCRFVRHSVLGRIPLRAY